MGGTGSGTTNRFSTSLDEDLSSKIYVTNIKVVPTPYMLESEPIAIYNNIMGLVTD